MTHHPPPLVVAVAPNGARRQRADHPAIPLEPNTIAETARRSVEAGAAMIHLHVRDDRGRHTLDPDRFQAAIGAIQKAVGDKLLIQMSSEAAGRYTPSEQIRAVREVRPEAVSLGLRELVPDQNAEQSAAGFFKWLSSEQILTQFILYHPEELSYFTTLCKRGIIPATATSLLLVIGNYTGTQPADTAALDRFCDHLEEGLRWMVCAFGSTEVPVLKRAAALGGHLRTGFENQLTLADGTRAADNADLVVQAVDLSGGAGRTIADADEARRLFRG